MCTGGDPAAEMLSGHAVLQRDRPIHIWGWSDPGACLRVQFHGQEMPACANALGMWSTYLKPEAACPNVLGVGSS